MQPEKTLNQKPSLTDQKSLLVPAIMYVVTEKRGKSREISIAIKIV